MNAYAQRTDTEGEEPLHVYVSGIDISFGALAGAAILAITIACCEMQVEVSHVYPQAENEAVWHPPMEAP